MYKRSKSILGLFGIEIMHQSGRNFTKLERRKVIEDLLFSNLTGFLSVFVRKVKEYIVFKLFSVGMQYINSLAKNVLFGIQTSRKFKSFGKLKNLIE